MTDALTHAPDCAGPRLVRFTDRRGVPMVKCRVCNRLTADTRRTPAAPTTAEPEPMFGRLSWRTAAALDALEDAKPKPAPMPSRYVCREHLQPVTCRGTGCPECDADRIAARGHRDPEEAEW